MVLGCWSDVIKHELHIFCDSSEHAYGVCAYLKVTANSFENVSLVLSKAKVAPIKRVTLPRLELLACVLGARIVTFILTALELPRDTKYVCYTDSQVALGWIRGDSHRWKTFVANRVEEVQSLTSPHSWRHCPGTENPADLLTRGLKADSLMKSDVWLKGPNFLISDDSFSETNEMSPKIEEAIIEELRSKRTVTVNTDPFVCISKFSSLTRTVMITAWILRFISKCKKMSTNRTPFTTLEEQKSAHQLLVKIAQREAYGIELKNLQNKKPLNRESSILKLRPFLGPEGLLRANCRLELSSDFSYDEKYPVILPKGHLSSLIVTKTHQDLLHAGVNQMITAVRNQYWIVGLRVIAKRVKRNCVRCQILEAKACEEPMAPVMADRLRQAHPFSTVGLDYAGPLYCLDCPGKKLYILLFTCAVIRAVHLELVESMSVPDFLMGFRKFVARRGRPKIIISDNFKSFPCAAAELSKIYGFDAPEWKFTCPRAPWWGGFFEIMVKSVKRALKRTLGLTSVTRAEMETVLTEAEACVNSRPLTFVGDDLDSSPPLTPFHFLLHRSGHLSKIDKCDAVSDVSTLKDMYKKQEIELGDFWRTWRDDYLKQLPAPKPRGKYGNLEKGSVVIIREDNVPRLQWPVGVVEEVVTGRDGVCRKVKVRTKAGIFWRPIQRLHDLELNVRSGRSSRVILPVDRYTPE